MKTSWVLMDIFLLNMAFFGLKGKVLGVNCKWKFSGII